MARAAADERKQEKDYGPKREVPRVVKGGGELHIQTNSSQREKPRRLALIDRFHSFRKRDHEREDQRQQKHELQLKMGELIELRTIERKEQRAHARWRQAKAQRAVQQNERGAIGEKREQNDRELG